MILSVPLAILMLPPLSSGVQNIHVCVGSLFVPEAYITATRQYVAQANSWSLEELCLEVNVTTAQGASLDAFSFGIKGQTRPANKKTKYVQDQKLLKALNHYHPLISFLNLFCWH